MTKSRHKNILLLILLQTTAHAAFTAFESGQVRPLAMSSTGDRLYVVNTPDNQLEVFAVDSFGLTLINSIPVGAPDGIIDLRDLMELLKLALN